MRMFKCISIMMLVALVFLQCSLCNAQGSLTASPARLFFNGTAGQSMVQKVRLSNSGSSPMILKSSLRDWERDSLGAKVYYTAGKLTTSNAVWLKLNADIIELAPGQERTVIVTMNVPKDVNPQQVKNSMLFFTQVNEQSRVAGQKKQKQMVISIRFEVGIHVYYTPANLFKKELNFIAFEERGMITTAEGKYKQLAITIQNTGEIATDAQLRLEVTDALTGEEFKFPDRPIAMLPGAKQIVYVNVPYKLAGRKLVAVAMLDSGTPTADLKVAEKAFNYDL